MSIKLTTLPNGVRLVTDRIEGVESLAVGVWVGVGTRHEFAHENGIAHMVEHMMFKGTPKRTARDISEVIENAGGHMNAYTAREMTAYYIHILKDHTDLALDVLADLIQNPIFPKEEIERERDVILQEIGMYEDTPDELVFDHAQEAAYPGQALGAPGLGKAPIIKEIKQDALFGYIRTRYAPNNIVISAAGAVDHEEMIQKVTALFDHLPAPPIQGVGAGYEMARYHPSPSLNEKDTEQAHIILGFQGVGRKEPDYQAARLLSNILGGGTSSRLWQEIREKRGLVYSVYSFQDAYADDGQFGVYAGTSPDNLGELVPIVFEEIKKIQNDVLDQEIVRAKTQIISGVRMGREKVMTRVDQQGRHVINYGVAFDPQDLFRKVEAVNAQDIKRVAKRIFSTDLLIAGIGPLKKLHSLEDMKKFLA